MVMTHLSVMDKGKMWVLVAIFYMMIAVLFIIFILDMLLEGVAQHSLDLIVGTSFIALLLLSISGAIFYYIPRSRAFPILSRASDGFHGVAKAPLKYPGTPMPGPTAPVASQGPQTTIPPAPPTGTSSGVMATTTPSDAATVSEAPLDIYMIRPLLLAFLITTILGSDLIALGTVMPFHFIPAFVFIVASPIFPALMWISYVHHHRPGTLWHRTVILTAVMGGMLAIIVPFLVNTAVGHYSELLASVLSAPLIEELSKGLMLLLVIKQIRGRFDGLFYGVTIGMGFAMAENLLYDYNHFMQGGSALGLGFMALARGLTGTLGHGVYTGLVGYALGAHLESTTPGGKAVILFGYLGAVALHMSWNGLLGGPGMVVILAFILHPILLYIILRYLYKTGLGQGSRTPGSGTVAPAAPALWPPGSGASPTVVSPTPGGSSPPSTQASMPFLPRPPLPTHPSSVPLPQSHSQATPPSAIAPMPQMRPSHGQSQTANAQSVQCQQGPQSNPQPAAGFSPSPGAQGFCPHCGSVLLPHCSFCGNCGRPTA